MNNAHNILNKRGIMTSYQMRHAEKTPTVELMEETVRDPLLELDPLWKFK
jgi:tyrosine-protein phosphatase non-receptor type 23